MVKNLPAMQETPVQSLDQEDPLEKGMDTSLVLLPGEFHGQRSLAGCNLGFPDGKASGKEPVCQYSPVLLPGECHGRRSLAGCNAWGCIELNTTEANSCKESDMIKQLTLSLSPLFTLIHPQFIQPAIQPSFTRCLLSYKHFLGFFMWGLLKSNKFTI